jgi:hypothetical protein
LPDPNLSQYEARRGTLAAAARGLLVQSSKTFSDPQAERDTPTWVGVVEVVLAAQGLLELADDDGCDSQHAALVTAVDIVLATRIMKHARPPRPALAMIREMSQAVRRDRARLATLSSNTNPST